jgi:hypothetical protein
MSRSPLGQEEECHDCGNPMRDHITHDGVMHCPEFIVDLETLRIDALRAVERYKTARNEGKPHERTR